MKSSSTRNGKFRQTSVCLDILSLFLWAIHAYPNVRHRSVNATISSIWIRPSSPTRSNSNPSVGSKRRTKVTDWRSIWFPSPEAVASASGSSTYPQFPSILKSSGELICCLNSLAYAEMRLTLATILRRFELENYETTVEDVRIARDYFVGVPEPGSQGVKAVVTEVL